MSIDICEELKQNFLDFSYEANSERAFADARDGLKPGQRACIWEMYSKGYLSNKPHVKSAKISGGVIASWHPHGDVSVYDTFARMSQKWINNIPEVDWHGNNGNIVIGNIPASDRYTEARLSKATEEGMLQGIKKNNVPMKLNFSEDAEWPEVLPAIFPRLLINGCQGIGVTIANTWIPMNLQEVTDEIIEYVETGKLDTTKPLIDFPTGGIIINKDDLHIIHETGKGKVIVRAKTEIKNNSILITELPYQVFIEPLIDDIKKLIEKEELTGIADIHNKTDKKRLLIEIECDETPLKVLTNLFSKTDLQKSYSANQYALISKTPKLLTLKDYIDVYLAHNSECIRKEYEYDLEKAKSRMEIVDGLLKALAYIDDIIALIKKSDSSSHAVEQLVSIYDFTNNQAKAIVAMRLGSLAKLEGIELNKEKNELTSKIDECNDILTHKDKVIQLVLERLKVFTKKYGTPRKTQLEQISIAKTKEEKEVAMVPPEKCVVVMTEAGTIKRIPATSFRAQRRNGKGVKTQEDITSAVIRTNTVDNLMIFTDQGRMYRLLVNDIPIGTNTTKGSYIRSLVEMAPDENPATMYSIYRKTDAKYVFFATKNGTVKKTSLEEYLNTKKKTGIAAITLREGDSLAGVTLIKDENIILVTEKGQVIRFNSNEVAPTSRTTIGVKGITLNPGDKVCAVLPIRDPQDALAIFATNGVGKRVALKEILLAKRAGKGICCHKGDDPVAAASMVSDEDMILIIGDKNSLCINANEIPTLTRTASGNALIKDSKILKVSKV